MSLLWLYKKGMTAGEPVIRALLKRRAGKGKEITERLSERYGIPSRARPDGTLIWVHVASVGEAQSMLSLINLILEQMSQAHVLVTSVTVTSAQLLAERLPERAFHQFSPIDHPGWVRHFLNHWKPDLVLWAESELWPNTLHLLSKRHVPVALLNAHMSAGSFRNWSRAKKMSLDMLSVFTVILAQTQEDADRYIQLGGRSVVLTENLKYAAQPLPCDAQDLKKLQDAIGHRTVWLYASTHDGEEELAAEIHARLSKEFPSLLSIIAPRHPNRREEIAAKLPPAHTLFRGEDKKLPQPDTQIYVADTLGEMGLLYRAAGLACIGRSFSRDGGGGHNPIEPALLRCAILSGPNVQNLAQIYADMSAESAAIIAETPEKLEKTLHDLLSSPARLKELQESGYAFADRKARSLTQIIEELEPLFLMANLPVLKAHA